MKFDFENRKFQEGGEVKKEGEDPKKKKKNPAQEGQAPQGQGGEQVQTDEKGRVIGADGKPMKEAPPAMEEMEGGMPTPGAVSDIPPRMQLPIYDPAPGTGVDAYKRWENSIYDRFLNNPVDFTAEQFGKDKFEGLSNESASELAVRLFRDNYMPKLKKQNAKVIESLYGNFD